MRRRTALVVLAVVVVACADADGRDSMPGSTSAPDTSATPVETPPPSTSAPASSVPPDTTDPPTTASSSTSVPTSSLPPATTDPPTEPLPVDVILLGEPDPKLLPALPPSEVDWTTVGPGWLLIDHPSGHGRPVIEPTTLDERGLYLVTPDDVVYGVAALPSDGSRIASVADDGRSLLLDNASGYALLDLTTTALQMVVPVSGCEPSPCRRESDITVDGTGIWVSETWYTDDQRHANHVRLSRVDLGTATWTTIVDEVLVVDEANPPSSWGISVVELNDSQIVVTTRNGTSLRATDGVPIRALDAPDAVCGLLRAWGSEHVLARCGIPVGEYAPPPEVPAEHCQTSGLWLIALDGTPTRPLAIPLDDRGNLSCWNGYADAEQLGDDLAVSVGGDGCSDDVVMISADGNVTQWLPDFAEPCDELLLGVRNGAWLIGAWSSDNAPEEAVFEVTAQGSTRTELPPGEILVL